MTMTADDAARLKLLREIKLFESMTMITYGCGSWTRDVDAEPITI